MALLFAAPARFFVAPARVYSERIMIMSEDRKTTYTPARKKAITNYLHNTVEEFKIRIPKGRKDIIKAHAESQGESMNAFCLRAIEEAMSRDKEQKKE